jgi:hypothetical protein
MRMPRNLTTILIVLIFSICVIGLFKPVYAQDSDNGNNGDENGGNNGNDNSDSDIVTPTSTSTENDTTTTSTTITTISGTETITETITITTTPDNKDDNTGPTTVKRPPIDNDATSYTVSTCLLGAMLASYLAVVFV